MTELADVQDLGSCVERREGSSPFFRINKGFVLIEWLGQSLFSFRNSFKFPLVFLIRTLSYIYLF